MTTNPKPLSIIAKCALCSIKTELFVCSHCDEVICQECVDKHQLKLNETLQEHWNLCRTKYDNLCRLSGFRKKKQNSFKNLNYLSLDIYDKDMINVESEIDRIRLIIEQRYMNLIQLIDNEKNNLLNKIEEHVQLNLSK
jgi:membrane-anchored protein YejM (alkaline phosphatase superfamily)